MRQRQMGTIANSAMVMVAAMAISACATQGDSAADASVGTVALQYIRATFSEHPDTAGQYVEPASRDTFQILSAEMHPASIAAEHLAIGTVVVTENHASAVLTGTICSAHSAKPLPTDSAQRKRYCVSNDDPDSSNPIFLIRLLHDENRGWQVTFPRPRPGGQSGSIELSSPPG